MSGEETAFLKGRELQQRGDYVGAAASYWEAIGEEPRSARSFKALGDCLFRLERYPQAVVAYRKALLLAPSEVGLLTNLGAAYQKEGRFQEALEVSEEVLRLSPKDRVGLNNCGLALFSLNRLPEAELTLLDLVAREPQWLEGWMNLGIVQKELGRFEDAEHSYMEVMRLEPGHPGAHVNFGMSRLLSGDFETGWREYLYRTRVHHPGASRFEVPLWGGELAPEKTVLVHAEQGLGDTLQFIRYLPEVAKRVKRVVLRVQAPLASLLGEAVGYDELWVEGEAAVPFDLHVPLLNLPAVFDAKEGHLPGLDGYLSAQGEPPPWLESVLPSGGSKMKVGVVWAGNPGHSNDSRRSCPFECLESLIECPEIAWFSLQKGAGEGALDGVPWASGVVNLGARVSDFNATAHALLRLDMLISVDTSTAHLAGGLGVPTWVMLPAVPDWRWQLNRDTSIWYRSVRLFRQSIRDDWSGPVEAMRNALFLGL